MVHQSKVFMINVLVACATLKCGSSTMLRDERFDID
jgi:hypothetical protein